MSIKSDFHTQLDAYFSGEMQGTDRLVFEGRIESNPTMKAEFEDQKDIIESIRASRAQELKTRLSNISVEPTLIGALLQNSLVKPIFYGIASIGAVTGSYLFYNIEPATHYHLETIKGKTEYLTASHINLDFNEKIAFTYRLDDNVVLPSDADFSSDEFRSVSAEFILAEESPVAQPVNFEVPDMSFAKDEEFGAPTVELVKTEKVYETSIITTPSKININQVNSRKYDFHYRIEDNRLYLYGKFDASPYEIIEVNTPVSKMIYFFYNGNYFHLQKGAGHVTRLSPIEDQALVKKLFELKSNYE